MSVPTPFHARTSALCESFSWKDWAGFHAVVSYEVHHEHEYSALRNAAGLIDISPLYKYRVSGRDAARLVDRVITRDAARIAVGQVAYTGWCDAEGKVIDDGTVARLDDTVFRWTAAEPNLRWITMNAHGLEATVEDVSERTAALALQGPTSRRVLQACADADTDLAGLKYFRLTRARIGGVPVEISRTGYTGDLGYEVWVDAAQALPVWDALVEAGRPHDLRPVGLSALDVARIEAGLILLDVDYVSARRALIPSQKYSPYEIGLGRLVAEEKAPFVGQAALRREARDGGGRRLVGLEVDWDELEGLYTEAGLPPQISGVASRASLPVFDGERQVGKATSSTWSPILKKMIALGTVAAARAEPGTGLDIEWTVDHRRRRVAVRVARLPFFDPPRKRA
jgi:aminomethyltransferase